MSCQAIHLRVQYGSLFHLWTELRWKGEFWLDPSAVRLLQYWQLRRTVRILVSANSFINLFINRFLLSRNFFLLVDKQSVKCSQKWLKNRKETICLAFVRSFTRNESRSRRCQFTSRYLFFCVGLWISPAALSINLGKNKKRFLQFIINVLTILGVFCTPVLAANHNAKGELKWTAIPET